MLIILWPAILVVLVLIGLVLLPRVRGSDDDTLRFSVETDGLSVESGQGNLQPGQGGSGGDSFSHSLPYEHEHDDYGLHTHD